MAEAYRAGTVAVLGRPNVGKSTLVNALVGARVSIVSPKAQTTRHRLLGIASFPVGQLLLVDTPGIHGAQTRAINRYMNRAARGALADVDAALLVIEAGRWNTDDDLAYAALAEANVPTFLVINKIDRIKLKQDLLPFITECTRERSFAAVHLLSALKRKGLEPLAKELIALMPESEPIYAEDEITDRSQRFLAAELVREQLMLRLGEEVPYSATVSIDRFDEDGAMLRIAATIWVEREGQKAIVVGKGGESIKQIGRASRENMERLFGRKVFLETWCKVREGWADDVNALSQFGYTD
ncbi:MAG TPA: GTPase Era [Xanthomonadaceae bacterium]|nr:GTPase Era [Xanthomonadaceae bacterium]